MQISLNRIDIETWARIVHLDGSIAKLKLVSIGLIPGKEVKVVRKAPFSSPLYISTRDFNLALLPEEAALIFVETNYEKN